MQNYSATNDRNAEAMSLSQDLPVFWHSFMRIIPVIVAGLILVSCRDKLSSETSESTEENVRIAQRSRESRWKPATREELSHIEYLTEQNTRRLGDAYRYLGHNRAVSSAIKGTVTIRYEESGPQTTSRRRLQQELPIELLPIWQRERVMKARTKRYDIYASGRQEAESIRTLSPEKRREWTSQWNEKHREQINKLTQEEMAAMQLLAPEPTQDQIIDLLTRINGLDPELGEEDVPVIEYLLPPVSELAAMISREKFDDQVVRLIEVHKLLSKEFPQSVTWGKY